MVTEADSRTRFMPIFRKIVQFHEFLSTSERSVDDIEKTSLSSHSKKHAKKAHQASVDSDIEMADQLLEIGEMLLDGTLTGDQFFRETLLETRLEYLSNRTERALKSCKQEDFLIPSDPYCLDVMKSGLNKSELKSRNMQFNEAATARNVQRYQFLNLLCSSMFKILKRDELSEESKKLLRASPQLWPLLKGETYDLGHPDGAGGFAIVGAYLQCPSVKPYFLSLNKVRDFGKRLTPLRKAAGIIENERITCSLWETEKHLNDAALYEAHFKKTHISTTEFRFPLMDPYIRQTLFECGLWEQDLPYPTFLQPSTHSTETEEVAFPHEPSFFETFPYESFDDTEEEVSVPSSLGGQSESIEVLYL